MLDSLYHIKFSYFEINKGLENTKILPHMRDIVMAFIT